MLKLNTPRFQWIAILPLFILDFVAVFLRINARKSRSYKTSTRLFYSRNLTGIAS